ncbi:MAG: phage holin family protein [Oscillospiraceae bacterium]
MRQIFAILFSAIGFFAPLHELFIMVIVFIGVDFVTGCLASYRRMHRDGKTWYFSSFAAWRTLYKLILSILGIVLFWLFPVYIFKEVDMLQNAPNVFCGAVCGVELWSWLENAGDITGSPAFSWVRKITINKVRAWDSAIGEPVPNEKTNNNDTK